MTPLEVFFGLIKIIPIADKWAERGFATYRDWKFKKNAAEISQGIEKAQSEGDTQALQDEINEKL